MMQAGLVRNHILSWLLPLAAAVLGVLLLHGIFAHRAVSAQQLIPLCCCSRAYTAEPQKTGRCTSTWG